MPAQLVQAARNQDLDAFEARALEMIESDAKLADFARGFDVLARQNVGDRVVTLGQMVLDARDPAAEPEAALRVLRSMLMNDAKNAELRPRVVEAYKQVYGDKPGFEQTLEASELAGGRPARGAIRMLDLGLKLEPGDVLISRYDNTVVEVVDKDLPNGLFILKRDGRPTTLPLGEMVREYERIARDDFRVMRALGDEKLVDMIQSDPARVIIGLIHAYDDAIDQDQLKAELVPQFIEPGKWSKWWSKARSAAKKHPNIVIEGRAPVMLSYSASARTTEDEAREAIDAANDPVAWMSTLEDYLKRKKAESAAPSDELLSFAADHITDYLRRIQDKRPSEALACALVLQRTFAKAGRDDPRGREVVAEILTAERDPTDLLLGIGNDTLLSDAIDALATVRPDDAAARAVELMPNAPATVLDQITGLAREKELLPVVQENIELAVADPVDYPELVYWIWKGPKKSTGINLPGDDELFARVIDTLSALGRTLHPPEPVIKNFRARAKAALSLKSHAKACDCVKRVDAARGVTLRRQLQTLSGLGDNTPARLLDALREAHPHLWKVKKGPAIPPWRDETVVWTTAPGLKAKEVEREHLVNVTMRENAKRIGEAASRGDLSENSEYKFALEERDLLRGRLAKMNQDMALARVMTPEDVPDDHVTVGSKVTLRAVGGDETREMSFLGPFEADAERGILNYQAPMAQSVMGKHVRDRASLTVDGEEAEFEVVEISNGVREYLAMKAEEVAPEEAATAE